MGRQRHGRRVQRGPDRLHARVAGRAETFRRLARHARHQQHVEVCEYRRQQRAAFVEPAQAGDIFVTRNLCAAFDVAPHLRRQPLALMIPGKGHAGGALVKSDRAAGDHVQPVERIRHVDIAHRGAGFAESAARRLRPQLWFRPARCPRFPCARRRSAARRPARAAARGGCMRSTAVRSSMSSIERAEPADGVDAVGGRPDALSC